MTNNLIWLTWAGMWLFFAYRVETFTPFDMIICLLIFVIPLIIEWILDVRK